MLSSSMNTVSFEICDGDGEMTSSLLMVLFLLLLLISLLLLLENNFKPEENRCFDREAVMNTIHRGDYFSIDELEGIVKSCPNGKSCGVDGVFYEDLKKMFPDSGHVLTNILNIMLINQSFDIVET